MVLEHVTITEKLHKLFQQFRLSTARKDERWKVGQVIGLDPAARIEKYGHVIQGGYLPLALGAFSYSHSAFSTEIEVGRYCSFAAGVQVIPGDHPMDWVTTSPVTHNPGGMRGLGVYLNDIGHREYRLYPAPIPYKPAIVGHDVWLGMNVLIKRGVRIGHGAIVGAGSLVTKDIPPYAIVAGTPARILRYRFAEPVIEALLRSEWWAYGPEALQALDPRDPMRFPQRLAAAIDEGLQPLDLPVLTGDAIFAAGEPYRP
jgi:acetyltransferase-like isoleucine patch superfamily enzyme